MKRFLYHFASFCSLLIGGILWRRHLHVARFARLDELRSLVTHQPTPESLLLGRTKYGHLLEVRATHQRRELGNLLVVAPTRGGKGLLATSQLLSWKHSVIVNDIKGELFAQTAGYRATLGKVFVIDPAGVGHRYDPLAGKQTEDALYSAATNLLFRPDEGDGRNLHPASH
jgi:type IV secretory pathway TraG/TraD family ATPase VirD4